MEALRLEEPESVEMDYDREADVLYVSFGSPRPALGLKLGDGVVARYVEKTGEIVGFTFVGLRRVIAGEEKPAP